MRRPTPLVALAARVAVAVSLLGSGAVAAGVPQMGTPASPGKATADEALDWAAIGDEAVRLLRAYVAIDTTNPPGNETSAALFLAEVLDAEGIDYEIVESAPGRGSLVARLRGNGSRGGHLVLLHHTDVVPADDSYWSVDPFAGVEVNGRIYGRGAADMKGYGAVQLATFLALHRRGIELGRDVILMATAGEETGGGPGLGYIVRSRPDLLAGVEFVLTEGGVMRDTGTRRVHFVETTQKMPLWLRLRATGAAGHGSQAIEGSAVNRLVRALDRIRTYSPEIQLVPAVASALRESAAFAGDPEFAAWLRDIEVSIGNPVVLERIEPQYGNLLRNTIAITVLSASSKTNVISPEAYAELDCRLLPGQNPDLFIATLRDLIDDPEIRIETLLRFDAPESPRGTALWRAIEEVARRADPRALVVPAVQAGFTDSHWFRERGIVSYGWTPILTRPGDGQTHGIDENVSVEAIRTAPRLLYELVDLLARSQPGA